MFLNRLTVCGSAAADSVKTRFNNQSDCWQDTPRIPVPKAVGCNRWLARVLLSILSCLLEQSKRIKRNPFAVPITLFKGPGAGDRTTHPVAQMHWLPATWPPDSYHDRTCTG